MCKSKKTGVILLLCGLMMAATPALMAYANEGYSYEPSYSVSPDDYLVAMYPDEPELEQAFSEECGIIPEPAVPEVAPEVAVPETEPVVPEASVEERVMAAEPMFNDSSCVGCDEPGCTTCSSSWFCGDFCGKPWSLPQPCIAQQMNIKLGGWMQQGVTFNGNHPANGFNGPVALNDRDSEYQLNQLWLFADRQADNGGCGFAWGGHFDMSYGSDWRYGSCTGLEDQINSIGNNNGLVVPQFYLDFAINRLKIRGGHFASFLGYEAVPAPLNFFYSHSLGYSFGTVNLATGAYGEYQLTENLAVQAGFTQGRFEFENVNGKYDFLGGFRLTSCDKKTMLKWGINSGVPNNFNGNRTNYSLVLERQATEQFKWAFVHELSSQEMPGTDANAYSFAGYTTYALSPKLQLGTRLEVLRDEQGVFCHGAPTGMGMRFWPWNPADGGYQGSFYEFTMGANWRPCQNLVVRPECRWDWFSGKADAAGMLPYNSTSNLDQYTFAVDMILTY